MDEIFLKKALRLAKLGQGRTNPNPMVGAVIVKNGKIIGQGYHRKAGLPHAEIEALKSVQGQAKNAALYVNLEPCDHYGRTPPCSEAIIKSGIRKAVFCTLDPNPKVKGKGAERLKRAGIEVCFGALERQARILNEAFFHFCERGRPFVAIKFAASLDGKIATKTHDSHWITSRKAREYARRLRANYQAVLVGANTVIFDNPHLGVREDGKKDPLRIILDGKLRIPLTSKVLRDQNVIIAATSAAPKEKIRTLENRGFSVMVFKGREIKIFQLLDKLKEMEIISILVEGGGDAIGRFFDESLVDKVYAFCAPIIIGGNEAVSAVGGKGFSKIKDSFYLTRLAFKSFADNFLVTGYPAERDSGLICFLR